MNPKMWRQFELLSKRLSAGSFKLYLDLLRNLLSDHQEASWTSEALGKLRAKDYTGLIELAGFVSKQQYTTPREHFHASQFAALVRKYPWPQDLVKFDPEAAARKLFWECEAQCLTTNLRFQLAQRGLVEGFPHFALDRARAWIYYVLGESPSLQSMYEHAYHGPGASVGTHGDCTNFRRKLLGSWTVSPRACDYSLGLTLYHHQLREVFAERCGASYEGVSWEEFPDQLLAALKAQCYNGFGAFGIVDYNKVSFVLKDAERLRVVGAEPLENGMLQGGVDYELREKLKRVGLDLSDQRPNMWMAYMGSMDDSDAGWCTADLISASDLNCIELYRALLPPAWFELLDNLRVHYGYLDGKRFLYQKFCSMGNGFCFSLQTLIYASLCHAVGAGRPGVDFRVFGDDIVVRKAVYGDLVELLTECGLKINPKKSFSTGPFRESCGTDWFNGQDVRPFTLDFALDSLSALFKFLNLTRRNERTAAFFKEVRPRIYGLIPVDFQFFRPFRGPADTGIDATQDEWLTCKHVRRSRKGVAPPTSYSHVLRGAHALRAFNARYQNLGAWEWKELINRAVHDEESYFVDWQGSGTIAGEVFLYLSGSTPDSRPGREGRPTVFVRYTSRTDSRSTVGAGATSSWLPGTKAEIVQPWDGFENSAQAE
jgi:hypothetical protein